MSTMTAAKVLDIARSRHVLFAQSLAPDGALLNLMSARQRTLLLAWGGMIEGLASVSTQIATSIGGALVGSSNGVPVYLTTAADGWPISRTAGGVPYVDFSRAAIAGDPFGEHGGTPGFPMPDDFLRFIIAACVLSDGAILPLDVVPERERLARTRRSNPTAFISGNRLVPVRPLASGNSGDVWASGISYIQMSYLPVPTLDNLSDTLVLPTALHEALIAGVAEALALGSPEMPMAAKNAFSSAARLSEQTLAESSVDMIGVASTRSVVFRA